MYNFIDVNEVSEVAMLPSEALQINGEFIENLIPGYRTLNVSGREALSPELETFETGVRDGSSLQSRRYPARSIIVRYQLISESNEAFREAYNKLASILDVEEAQLIFNDEPDKFFTGTLSSIGEVAPGVNSVVGEFEFLCVDPFKYSVAEYEAEPAFSDNSFLIDYNGTHRAYPTLEAEFYNENEADGALTGNGDCGFVAFFNEREKIIQLGNADEVDAESYAKSQTLVNQLFQKETAWGNIAQTNWAMNNARLISGNTTLMGSVSMQPASYAVTTAPTTSGTLLSARSTVVKPYVDYKVTAQASGREADRTKVKVSIVTVLSGTSSGTVTVKAGAKITLNKTNIYTSSDASSSAGTKTGTFYLWDASIIRNRIRITNSSSNVGKSGQVTGWVNVSDINISTSAAAIGTGYGLKGSIQIGGEWHSVTIKGEGESWKSGSSHTAALTITVKNLDEDTTMLEDIKFKVERTDDNESKVGLLDETACNDFEISSYTAPTVDGWCLSPETYGSSNDMLHGPSITRVIPADAAGNVGAANFSFSFRNTINIGSGSASSQEMGDFQALLITEDGSGNKKVLAGMRVFKNMPNNKGTLRFYINHAIKQSFDIDLSANNEFFSEKNGKTSTIRKTGSMFEFNVGGITAVCFDSSLKDTAATEIVFHFGQFNTRTKLSHNGLHWVKFVKNNCDTYSDIPNKFSSNDVVSANCESGEVLLNNIPAPSLGALGNDWEDFYLTPGLNQIGFAYSSWVSAAYAPKFKIRYREVFI